MYIVLEFNLFYFIIYVLFYNRISHLIYIFKIIKSKYFN